MDPLIKEFVQNHPQHVARVLESLPIGALRDFILEKPVGLDEVLPRLSPSALLRLFEHAQPEQVSDILFSLPDLQIAMLLKQLESSQRKEVLARFPDIRQANIKRLMQYNRDQIGYYAKKPKWVLAENVTIQQVLDISEKIAHRDLPIYVVNQKYQLKGQVDLLKLVRLRNHPTESIMALLEPRVALVSGLSKIESIKETLQYRPLKNIAVIGPENLLIGIISKIYLKHQMLPETTTGQRSGVEEYIHFSEMLWSGLNKFWGSLK